MTYSKIAGTGHYLPNQRRTNDDLSRQVDTSDEWITERTGIKERRIASVDEGVASMGAAAARKALDAANISANDIDMIIVATTSADCIPVQPVKFSLAGITETPAFDVGAACQVLFSHCVADQYIKTGQHQRVLVIGSDVLARLCHPEDRNTLVLFGDGAGAVVLESSAEAGILSTHLASAGEFAHLLGAAQPNRSTDESERGGWMYMKGNEVFRVAVDKLSRLVTDTLADNDMSPDQLDWLIPHQANLRIIKATAKKLKLPMSQVIITLDKTGNTSAASVPIALDVAVRDGRVKRGDNLLLEAFGGGFAWGSALVKF